MLLPVRSCAGLNEAWRDDWWILDKTSNESCSLAVQSPEQLFLLGFHQHCLRLLPGGLTDRVEGALWTGFVQGGDSY